MDVGDVTQLFGSFLTIFLNFKSLLALEAIAEKFWPGNAAGAEHLRAVSSNKQLLYFQLKKKAVRKVMTKKYYST